MADTAVEITAGTGTNIDTRTEGTNGNHRQVIVIGDPATNAGVAPVDATNGLAVDVKQSALPSGAATAANQTTGNTALSAIQTAVQLIDNAISGNEMQVDVVTLPAIAAGENHIGQVATPLHTVLITPTLDTSAYDSGDVLFTNTSASVHRVSNGRVRLRSICVIDEDDQGIAMTIVFARNAVSLGTINSTPDIADFDASEIQGHVAIASGDYLDLGGVRVATKSGLDMVLGGGGDANLYVGAITGGAPTHTASGLKIWLGVEQN
jgi:hypothetical protein